MNDDLISRSTLIAQFQTAKSKGVSLRDSLYLDGVMAVIDSAPAVHPTADVAEVRHGRWIKKSYLDSGGREDCEIGACYMRTIYECSLCGRIENFAEPFCHCGARMDGEDKP